MNSPSFPKPCVLCDRGILSASNAFSPSPVAEKGWCCAKCLYHDVEPARMAARQEPNPAGIAQFPFVRRATWYSRLVNRRNRKEVSE